MPESELQKLLDQIEAFSNTQTWTELDPVTRLDFLADTSGLLRQATAGESQESRLQAAQDLVARYGIP